MSCELPIISTSVGSVPLLLDQTWQITVNPEESVILEANKKMSILSKYKKLRHKIGKRNRMFIKKYFDWKNLQPIWDKFFVAVYNNDQHTCNSLSNDILKNFNLPLESKPMILSGKQKKLIVHLAKIPCANSGFELCKLINEFSNEYYSRYILFHQYSNQNQNICFRYFPIDLNWETQKDMCIETLKKADIIHIHHDIIDDKDILDIVSKKKVIWTLYNLVQSLKWKKGSYNLKY